MCISTTFSPFFLFFFFFTLTIFLPLCVIVCLLLLHRKEYTVAVSATLEQFFSRFFSSFYSYNLSSTSALRAMYVEWGKQILHDDEKGKNLEFFFIFSSIISLKNAKERDFEKYCKNWRNIGKVRRRPLDFFCRRANNQGLFNSFHIYTSIIIFISSSFFSNYVIYWTF